MQENVDVIVQSICQELHKLANTLGVDSIASEVIDNKDFQIWTGSPRKEYHHYGKYGLLIHTHEVISLCLSSIKTLSLEKDISPKDAFLAALFHDFGKIQDYSYNKETEEWNSTDGKRKIYHICRSYLWWNQIAMEHNIDKQTVDEISHAILAHHGRLEWKSPVTPQTKLAWLLHLCDNMSARLCDVETLKR